MFECKVRMIPLMGKSVCEVTTAQGTHTAIAPTHKQAWAAAMTMARMVMEQTMGEEPTPAPGCPMGRPRIDQPDFEQAQDECNCPACRIARGEAPHGPRHH